MIRFPFFRVEVILSCTMLEGEEVTQLKTHLMEHSGFITCFAQRHLELHVASSAYSDVILENQSYSLPTTPGLHPFSTFSTVWLYNTSAAWFDLIHSLALILGPLTPLTPEVPQFDSRSTESSHLTTDGFYSNL